MLYWKMCLPAALSVNHGAARALIVVSYFMLNYLNYLFKRNLSCLTRKSRLKGRLLYFASKQFKLVVMNIVSNFYALKEF